MKAVSGLVTEDSVLTKLHNSGTIVDTHGNSVTIVGTDGTEYVSGTGKYKITAASYSTDVDLSGVCTVDSWADYDVEKP